METLHRKSLFVSLEDGLGKEMNKLLPELRRDNEENEDGNFIDAVFHGVGIYYYFGFGVSW